MAKVARTDATWIEIDPTTLPDGVQAQYDHYKTIYRQARQAREAFEARLAGASGLGEGKRMIFGYNYGKLSIAIVDDDRKPAKANPKLTLAQFIATQADAGNRH